MLNCQKLTDHWQRNQNNYNANFPGYSLCTLRVKIVFVNWFQNVQVLPMEYNLLVKSTDSEISLPGSFPQLHLLLVVDF